MLNRLPWIILACLLCGAALAQGVEVPVPVPAGDGLSIPLGNVPPSVAVAWGAWMLSRWKPRLHIVIERAKEGEGE